jgi:alanine racemase
MDQIVVDCGPDAPVSVGDEVVLIGSQGPESLTVWDWATVLGTIGNEVLTEIGSRVPRVLVDTDRAGRSSAEEES